MPTLSEADSKELLGAYGVPFPDERVVSTADAAVGAAGEIGYPVVVKLGGDAIAHKTERGLVRLGLGSADQVRDGGRGIGVGSGSFRTDEAPTGSMRGRGWCCRRRLPLLDRLGDCRFGHRRIDLCSRSIVQAA